VPVRVRVRERLWQGLGKVLHILQPWKKIFDFLSEKMGLRVMAAPCLGLKLGLGLGLRLGLEEGSGFGLE
jgi:hypothetical protein